MSRPGPDAAEHHQLPRSAETPHPRRLMLHTLRPVTRFLVQRLLSVRVHGADLVPVTGPAILAANHVGVVDGPLLAMFAPRPVHALTKAEMFSGRLGGFLRGAGQIRLDRSVVDPSAMKGCLRVLRDGGVTGIFPEGARGAGDLTRFHGGAAYLGLVSGAPIVPVTFLGTREPGTHSSALPLRTGHIDIVFGAPYRFDAAPWPRGREQVTQASLLLREHMLAGLDEARQLTARELPGPLPGHEQIEDGPNIGAVEQGAS